ncbi:MAG TPA: hypothetical protein VMJ10_21975, partial [Kofleriaceae bacterium]|nr:hypothetical protein [Kofleriaceae bacterium]
AREELAHTACVAGIVESCAQLVRYHDRHRFRDDISDAERRLVVACDAGEADACEDAPDRNPVPAKDLCAAADYAACAKLGCLGDRAAEQLATAHHVAANDCERVRAEANAPSPEAVIAKLAELRDQICACKDTACMYPLVQLAGEQTGALVDRKVSSAASTKLGTLMTAISTCEAKLAAPASP